MLFSFGPGSQGPPQGPYDPRDPFPQFKVEEMDFSKFHRFLRLGLLGLALIVLWSGLNWAQGFYTDWLWYSSLDHQGVLDRKSVV